MARFRHVRDLSCSPAAAWRLLTEPDQMNRWSTAPITLQNAGVGDRPDAVGALRRVRLPGDRATLREVVEVADVPRRFVYRVYDGGPLLLAHRGVQTLVETPTGCRLTWTVDMTLAAGLSAPFARIVGRQVGESLDALEEIAASLGGSGEAGSFRQAQGADVGAQGADMGAQGSDVRDQGADLSTPPRSLSLSKGDLAALHTAAEASLAEQRRIGDELAADDDPKQWFARVYQYVTEEMIAVADGRRSRGAQDDALDHPDWVLALIPVFHDYFTRALRSYQAGEPCRGSWQKAWSICESEDARHPERPVMRGLLAGVSAHIDTDLPDALLDVQRARYPEQDLREFLPDYLRLAPVFTAASDRLLADLPRSHKPWWVPVAARIHPSVRDDLLGRKGFHVGRHRVQAFERAVAAQQVT
ncbi:MAG: DUF5995 family protein [Gordonia sp. (in: high G+C Gram-positive bacteria)]|uniref:SRPBCC family protein n=1 Tax=Gordonia sp. (in: high G+C Gram-positive bacteria) TaxID=84139 RepID=UPI0039E3035B